MIYMETKIRVADNSGAKWIKCIKTFKSSKKSGLKPLGLMVVSIQKIKINKNNVLKGKIYKAVLIRGNKNFERPDGSSLKFKQSAAILLNEKNLPIATRIIGPIYKEFRNQFLSKILILSNVSI